jgi:hypothetical protein
MAKRKRTDNTMTKRKRTDNTMVKRKRTDNTMAKRKRTDNTMAKRKRTDNTMVKRKRTNNHLRNITQKAKDRTTRTPLKTEDSGTVDSSCSTCATLRVTPVTNPIIRHACGGKDTIMDFLNP